MKKLLYIFCMACVVVGCARMGSPDGGWYDDDPPVVIGSNPVDQSTNVSAKKISIYFDEYIKLEDATNKVIVSPPQLEVTISIFQGISTIGTRSHTLDDKMSTTIGT